MANGPQKDEYEIFMDRINVNDKVLVKAPIQNKVNKECYFLGTVRDKSTHSVDQKHVVVIKLEGETDRRAIKLKNIGSIGDVKKTIIPMDFIFKDENIKAGKIENAEFECSSLDANCDGEDLGKGDMDDDGAFVIALDENDTVAEITVGGTKGDEALVVEDIEDEEQFKDFPEQQGGGKKKKKKNRSRSKKNKKKRKRKNSTKKKN